MERGKKKDCLYFIRGWNDKLRECRESLIKENLRKKKEKPERMYYLTNCNISLIILFYVFIELHFVKHTMEKKTT